MLGWFVLGFFALVCCSFGDDHGVVFRYIFGHISFFYDQNQFPRLAVGTRLLFDYIFVVLA
jgi:hypothetical protein